MHVVDLCDVMDAFIFEKKFSNELEDFELIFNVIDDKTYEIIFDYENITYCLMSKFFVVMERIMGGYCLEQVIFDRKKDKMIFKGGYGNSYEVKEWFDEKYEKIKKCFIVDKEELEHQIEIIDGLF